LYPQTSTSITLLAGRPKIGKSWLALQIAHAVGTGGQVLDRQVERGKVLYVTLEDSPRRSQERLKKQHAPAETDLLFAFAWPPLAEQGFLELRAEIEKERYRLVVIDTFSLGGASS
jgi:predicted ATP-dependent serine protease